MLFQFVRFFDYICTDINYRRIKLDIKVNKGSSIWKLATVWGAESLPNNFCHLVRRVLWVFLMISILVTLLSVWIGFTVASIAASISTGSMIWSPPVIGLIALLLLIAGLFIFAYIADKVENSDGGIIHESAKVYSAYKNKFCPSVTEKARN